MVDHTESYNIINLSKELMDSMKDSKIAFQFLALSLLVIVLWTSLTYVQLLKVLSNNLSKLQESTKLNAHKIKISLSGS